MRKLVAAIVAVALAAMALPALAATWTMYVQEDGVNVYDDKSVDAAVVRTLDAGEKVTVEDVSKNGKWYAIFYEKKGKQRIGWVQARYLGDDPPQSRCEHDFGRWQVETEATCTRAGYKVRYCRKCGVMEEAAIPRLGHTFGAWRVTREATCARAGERTRTCAVCGYRDREQTLAPHTYGDWRVTREATCTEEGERTRACKVCGAKEQKPVEKLAHSYGAWSVVVETTDHSSGVRSRACRMCGRLQREDFDPEGTLRKGDRGEAVRAIQQLLLDQGYLKGSGVDGIFGGGMEKSVMQFQKEQGLVADGVVWPQTARRLNHDFGPWETVRMPTRARDGERVRTCRDCGYRQREVVSIGGGYERGSRGEAVRALQQLLRAVGYDAGGFDGIYGRKLDTAYAAFARDNGVSFTEGKLLPAHVDALANAWFGRIGPGSWKGEGGVDTPVNLALTVNPAEGDSVLDDVCRFTWTLTNLGSQRCTYTMLLLSYGNDPTFKGNSLVVDLDGVELKPNGQNTASGSFSVAADWGEGSLSFAALAVVDRTGDKWLSNAAVFERGGAARVAAPRPVDVDPAALPDGTYPVAFNPGDILSGASGVFMNAVHVYALDTYDPAAVEGLALGDTLVVSGESIAVETVKRRGDTVTVNRGTRNACALRYRADLDAYVIDGDDDLPTYTERGLTTLTLDPSAVFTDSWDIDSAPVTVEYAAIVPALQESPNRWFDPYSTTVTIQNGRVVRIERVYVP